MKKIRNDFILIGTILLLACIGLIIYFSCSKKENIEVLIYQKNELVYQGDLENNKELEFENVHIVIKECQVYVSHSNCKDQVCVMQPPIYRAGQSIICLPNQITIKLDGKAVDIGV